MIVALLRSMLQTNIANRSDHEAQKLSANENRVRIKMPQIIDINPSSIILAS